jgi:hypothetical protein
MVIGSEFGGCSLRQNLGTGQKEWDDPTILGFLDSYRNVEKMIGKLL